MRQDLSTRKLVDGYHKAFIDASVNSDPAYSPQFISNGRGQKVLSAIEKELKGCDDLFFSVAFITMSGIAPLLGTLKDLEKKGTKGRILTTDYLMFSDPRALDKLDSLKNIDLRVFKTGENNVGFHTKGYIVAFPKSVLMPLFVRKNKDDQTSKEFYFLGTIQHNGHTQEFIMPDTDNIHAVEIGYRLDTPVESNLYEYITERSL